MCLFESVPPKQKQTIDLPERRRAAALQRGCCAGGAGLGSDIWCRCSEPGNINFSARTLGLAGEERSSRFKRGFILPLKKAREPSRARKVLPGLLSLNYNFINISCSLGSSASAEREPALPARRAAEAKRAAPRQVSPSSSFFFFFFFFSFFFF